jgi:hypothetical protein
VIYGKDGSQSCLTGDLYKFDVGMPGNVTTMYFQLIINGSYSLIPAVAYVKYGTECCTINVQNGGCLEEICLPANVEAGGPNAVCQLNSPKAITLTGASVAALRQQLPGPLFRVAAR